MTTDNDSNFNDDAGLSEERRRAVDEFGHRAGAALRRPAPEHGLAGIMHNARNQRLIRGAVAAAGVAALVIVGVVVLGEGDDEQNRVINTDTVQTTPSTAAPTTAVVADTPTTTTFDEPATILGTGTDEPTAAAAPVFPSCTATLDLPATGSATPDVRCWQIPEPGPIEVSDVNPVGGFERRVLVLSHGGTQVETFGFSFGGQGEFGPLGSIVPTDEAGAPLTLTTLEGGVGALAVSTDGRLVWLDPYTLTAGLIAHPGVVSGVAGPWTVGIDGGRPVIWHDTGLAHWFENDAALSGQSVATVMAVGEPGATGPALITRGVSVDDGVAYALLPEPDGTSRLWIVPEPTADEPPVRTDLVFREPNGIASGLKSLWVSDAEGLHAFSLRWDQVDNGGHMPTPDAVLWPPPNDPGTPSTPPYRLLNRSVASDGGVFVIDAEGRVLHAGHYGTLEELLRDPDLSAGFIMSIGDKVRYVDGVRTPVPAREYSVLLASHRAQNQFIVVDPTAWLLGQEVECTPGQWSRVLSSQGCPDPGAVSLVSCDARAEIVTIQNTGGDYIWLSGYELHDVGAEHTTNLMDGEASSLAPGQQLRIVTGPDAIADPFGKPYWMADGVWYEIWTKENMWDNNGDTAFLVAPDGTETSASC